jgi:hypothetical protein
MVRGMVGYAKRPAALTKEIIEKSAFMSERQTSFQKDIHDFMNDVAISSPLASRFSKVRGETAKAGFWLMIKVQFHSVDLPTWLGAYNAEIEKGSTEERAISYADRMVARAQDSALMADRSGFERGTLSETTRQADFVRMFTTLGGYMIKKLNRAYVTGVQAQKGWQDADDATARALVATNAAADLALLFVFEAAFMALLYSMILDEEDEVTREDYVKFITSETAGAVVGGVPFVRDAASAFRGFGGGGVYGSVAEVPARVYTQAMQGEADTALIRSLGDLFGVVTGLPSTATVRALQGAFDESTSPAEALFGSNPLTR